MAKRLKELENRTLERQAYNEIPPRVEYRWANKGQGLVEPIFIYETGWKNAHNLMVIASYAQCIEHMYDNTLVNPDGLYYSNPIELSL